MQWFPLKKEVACLDIGHVHLLPGMNMLLAALLDRRWGRVISSAHLLVTTFIPTWYRDAHP